MLAACAGMATDAPVRRGAPDQADIVETVWRGENSGWVHLVEAEPAAAPLDHPVRVDTAWLRDVLASVEVEAGLKDRSWSVFNDAWLDRLVPALAHGLARAEPDQEVVFAVVGERGGLRFLDPVVVTTGRVFVQDGRLNVIFGLIDAPVESAFGDEKRPFTPGSRAGRVGEDWEIRSLTWGSDPVREDWFAIAAVEGGGPLPPLAESLDRETRPSEPPAPQAEPAGDTAQPPNAAPAAGQPGEEAAYDDVRRRLEVLKRLHGDGLITDQEYDRKRKEILSDL